MYHYVRDFARSKYPRLKGLDRVDFIGQLDYLARHYVPVSIDQMIAAWYGEDKLPDRAVHLTFDDGLIDHYEVVFPLVSERGWKCSFFPIAQSCTEHKVADVHKIHHVLAAIDDPKRIYVEMLGALDKLRAEYHLSATEEYQRLYLTSNRVGDEVEVNFIKRMLQKGLPVAARTTLLNDLFRRYVSRDEAAISGEIYACPAHLKQMLAEGMNIGSHGWSHRWMGEIADEEVATEIYWSRDFLVSLGVDAGKWTISYPYGSVNERVVACARKAGAVFGLTSHFDLADPARDTAFTVPRLDTNHVPHTPHASPLIWNKSIRN
jgi:peptidoglycan/xylan/chitin deacetylase (PgdA/CDA1 family)